MGWEKHNGDLFTESEANSQPSSSCLHLQTSGVPLGLLHSSLAPPLRNKGQENTSSAPDCSVARSESQDAATSSSSLTKRCLWGCAPHGLYGLLGGGVNIAEFGVGTGEVQGVTYSLFFPFWASSQFTNSCWRILSMRML